jgi:hypothetical protein
MPFRTRSHRVTILRTMNGSFQVRRLLHVVSWKLRMVVYGLICIWNWKQLSGGIVGVEWHALLAIES